MIRAIERLFVWIKADLQLSKACKNTHGALLSSLTTTDVFADELKVYFTAPNKIPFRVATDDPAQVASLKKILNALAQAEKAFLKLEQLDLRPKRYQAAITADLVKNAYEVANELFGCIQVINKSTPEIQRIVGSQFKVLLPKLGQVSQRLQEFTPDGSEQPLESSPVSRGMALLPQDDTPSMQGVDVVGNMVSQLPHYFEVLQNMIAPSSTAVTSAESYKAMMADRAQRMAESFDVLSKHSGWTVMPTYLSTLKVLSQHSIDLLNTGAPLTKAAYKAAALKLNQIKHEILPGLIADLEAVEESMGLKTGILTDPVLKQMNAYYNDLAKAVELIAEQADVIDSVGQQVTNSWWASAGRWLLSADAPIEVGPKVARVANLTTLQDDTFQAQVGGKRERRLVIAELASQDRSKLDAANRFFDKLASYGALYQASCKWSLGNLTPDDKKYLMNEYKQFQADFAVLYPTIDMLIVENLNKTNEGMAISRALFTDYSHLARGNGFKDVLACRESVTNSLSQSLQQSAFEVKLIKRSAQHSNPLVIGHLARTHVPESVPPFIALNRVNEVGKPAVFYREQRIAVNVQRNSLEAAQVALKQFFDSIRGRAGVELRTLTGSEKETLRQAYKKFQPHVVAWDSEFNTRLVALLNDEASEDALRVRDVAVMEAQLNQNITAALTTSIRDEASYATQQQAAQKAERVNPPLDSIGFDPEIRTQTLFGTIHSWELSSVIAEFTQSKFIPFLRDNLDPAVLTKVKPFMALQEREAEEERVAQIEHEEHVPIVTPVTNMLNSLSNIMIPADPFDAFEDDADKDDVDMVDARALRHSYHQDSPNVAMYKKLLNTLHYLQISLKELEAMNTDNDTTVGRGLYIKNVLSLLGNINATYSNLTKAAANPGLKAIMTEAMDLLAPLRKLPLVGDYLPTIARPAPPVVPVLDVIAAWKNEQHIVEINLSIVPQPEVAVAAAVIAVAPIAVAAPVVVPPAVAPQDYLQEIGKLLYQIPDVLKKANPGYAVPQSATADAELNAKSAAFIASLSQLSFDADSLKNILAAVNEVNTQIHSIGSTSRELIFKRVGELRMLLGAELVAIADKSEFEIGLQPGALSAPVAQKFDAFFKSLVTNLPFEHDQDRVQLLVDTQVTEKRLVVERARLVKLNEDITASKVNKIIFSHRASPEIDSLFNRLVAIRQNAKAEGKPLLDYKDDIAHIYKRLQPYLAEEEPDEFVDDYITSITDAEDLSNALKDIGSMDDIVRCDDEPGLYDEIMALKDSFNDPKMDLNRDPNPARDKFLRVYQQLQPYLYEISRSFSMRGNGYLRNLTSAADFKTAVADIIKLRPKLKDLVDGRTAASAQRVSQCEHRIGYLEAHLITEEAANIEKVEAFKLGVLRSYLDVTVKGQFETELGPFAGFFLERIKPDFLAQQGLILQGLTLEDRIKPTIAQRVDDITSDIFENAEDTYQAYSDLNVQLQRVQAQIAAEKLRPDNPCHREKLELLEAIERQLTNPINFPPHVVTASLSSFNQEAKKVLAQMKKYNQLIEIHNTLIQLREYIQNNPDENPAINEAKLTEVNELLRLITLDPARHSVKERLEQVSSRGLSEPSVTILSKNSDWFLIKVLKALRSLFTGWQSKEDELKSSFKERLHKITPAMFPSSEVEPRAPAEDAARPLLPVDEARLGAAHQNVGEPERDDDENHVVRCP